MTLWFLRFLNGSKAGQAVRLSPGANRVGRRPECEICLTDPGISGLHATIEITESSAVLRDENSLNGTYVKDFSISRFEVAPGLEISFGLVRACLEKMDRSSLSGDEPPPPREPESSIVGTAASAPVTQRIRIPFEKSVPDPTGPVRVDHAKKPRAAQVPASVRGAKPLSMAAPPQRLQTKSIVALVSAVAVVTLGLWFWAGGGFSTAVIQEEADPSGADQARIASEETALSALPPAAAGILPPTATTGNEPRLFWVGGNEETRLHAVHALSNGDFLLAGASTDLDWTAPAARTEWPVKEPRGEGGSMTAFVLHVSGDWRAASHRGARGRRGRCAIPF